MPTVWRNTPHSSNVSAVGWNRSGMLVRFQSGALYRYRGVSRQRAVAMVYAPSVGSYLNRRIKGHFDVERLS